MIVAETVLCRSSEYVEAGRRVHSRERPHDAFEIDPVLDAGRLTESRRRAIDQGDCPYLPLIGIPKITGACDYADRVPLLLVADGDVGQIVFAPGHRDLTKPNNEGVS